MNPKIILIITLAFLAQATANAQVGIGTTSPDETAVLEVQSTTKGFLPPRMDTDARDGIGSPAEGLTIYNTDNKCLEVFDNADWISICDGSVVTSPPPPPSTVTGSSGREWMDRNLGATRVAENPTDYLAYGDLYQWGRGADGHQTIVWESATGSDRTEQKTTDTSDSTEPGTAFISGSSNWYTGSNPDDLWKEDGTGVNNPCPSGFRVPTDAEWQAESVDGSWGGTQEASDPPLKLPLAGRRVWGSGSLEVVGTYGHYWSSTISSNKPRYLNTGSGFASVYNDYRAMGFSVRCLKD